MDNCQKVANSYIKFWRVVALFVPFYIAFGVVYPVKMAYINNITVSYLYVIGSFVLNDILLGLALTIRSFLGT